MINIRIISSKSDAHRALIAAALSDRKTKVTCRGTSKDIEATKECLKALNPDFPDRLDGHLVFRCGESGSTFRFLLPVAAAKGISAAFLPEGRLPERPLTPLYEEMEAHGVRMSPQGEVPFFLDGKLQSGTYRIPGNISSQFISGLLFALPLLNGDSRIEIPGKLESSGYVRMTEKTISRFGVRVLTEPLDGDSKKGQVLKIPGGQVYEGPRDYPVEGDWSNGAFWLAAGILGDEPVRLSGLPVDSAQGDRKILPILRAFGGDIAEERHVVPGCSKREELVLTAYPSRGKLHGTTVSCSEIPDLVPILSLVAQLSEGDTEFTDAGRLRLKESDRIASTVSLLRSLGGNAEEEAEGLHVFGVKSLRGGICDGANDHRIVMTAAVASLAAENEVVLHGSKACEKSYPDFFKEFDQASLMKNLRLE
ncbi:MAG: 3-phosphoshikimate 1-carboxyvinyltransferase [Eubacteriales bacterium]|nr:3-phosphoshikimate 1-carboxyvinyltransferase [Eubacteriales bacterium]